MIKQPRHPEKKEELLQFADEGEASAIALALEIHNCILIIDGKKGRDLAARLKIQIVGTFTNFIVSKNERLYK